MSDTLMLTFSPVPELEASSKSGSVLEKCLDSTNSTTPLVVLCLAGETEMDPSGASKWPKMFSHSPRYTTLRVNHTLISFFTLALQYESCVTPDSVDAVSCSTLRVACRIAEIAKLTSQRAAKLEKQDRNYVKTCVPR